MVLYIYTFFFHFSSADCSVEVVNISDEKKANLTQETDISLILQNSYGTDVVSFFFFCSLYFPSFVNDPSSYFIFPSPRFFYSAEIFCAFLRRVYFNILEFAWNISSLHPRKGCLFFALGRLNLIYNKWVDMSRQEVYNIGCSRTSR